jgi:hypothetical protein
MKTLGERIKELEDKVLVLEGGNLLKEEESKGPYKSSLNEDRGKR